MKKAKYLAVEKIKQDITNKALVFGTIAGLIIYLLDLGKSFEKGFQYSLISDAVVILVLIWVTYRRKLISLEIKSYIILIVIFILVIIDIYEIGILSANKILVILIPFFSIFSLSNRATIVFSCLVFIAIITLATLQINGVLSYTISENIDGIAWAIDILMIGVVAMIVLSIFTKFNGTYEEMIFDLIEGQEKIRQNERRLREYKDQLENLVSARTAELEETNELLVKQTKELTESVRKLNETRDQLVQSEKLASVGLLASGIAHELNNPLNFIRGGIARIQHYLRDELESQHLKQLEAVMGDVNGGIDRASSIVKSLNQYGHARESMVDMCNLNVIVENCVIMLSGEFKEHQRLERYLASNLPDIRGNNGKVASSNSERVV